MNKYVWILVVMSIPFCSEAYDGNIAQSGSCGATDADCHYDLYEDGHLEISGNGEMSDWNYSKGNAAPWGPTSWQEGADNAVKSVNIEGITKIGTWAFLWCKNLEEVNISDTVKEIAGGAFEQTRDLKSVVIPSSVDKLDWYVFSTNGMENIIIEGTPEMDETALIYTSNATIYCQESIDCGNYGNGSNGTIVPYQKQGGVFILDGDFYYSGTDMVGGTNKCAKELMECKRDVLEAKGICEGSACDTLIQSDGNYMLKYNGKTYQSINDLLNGKYDVRRIYTIEEANFVAGDKNRVSIRYR